MSKELEAVVDHVDDALGYLPEQFKPAENFQAFISAFVEVLQDAEDMLQELWTSRFIDNATGARLDGLGSIVGEERNGLEDADYRVRIKTRIRVNVSSGLEVDIYDVFALVLQDTTPPINLVEYYPAAMVLYLTEYSSVSAEVLAALLYDVRAASVDTQLVYLSDAASESFQFAAADASEFDIDEGFSYYTGISGWSDIDDTTFGGSTINEVAFGDNGVYVAVGSGGKGAYSTDGGINWTAVGDMKFGATSIVSVTWAGGSRFVAVGSSGKGAYSTDAGVTWTAVGDMQFGGSNILSVAYNGSTLVAVGVLNKAAYSTDGGVTWTAVSPFSLSQTIQGVTADRSTGRFVCVTSNARSVVSDDGITWSSEVYDLTALLSARSVACIRPNVFVAVGSTIARSTDGGASWSLITTPTETLNTVAAGEGVLIAAGNDVDNAYMSIDAGVSWTAFDPGLADDALGAAIGYLSITGPTAVLVGASSTGVKAAIDMTERGGAFADVMEA